VRVPLPYSFCICCGGSSAARGGRAPPLLASPKYEVSVTLQEALPQERDGYIDTSVDL